MRARGRFNLIDGLKRLDWIFDPLPPSGARVGGIPIAHVFRPTVDVFVRELIQNSVNGGVIMYR